MVSLFANFEVERSVEQQKGDKTLESVRAWAERGERGYGFQDGIIVHSQESEHGEEWKRVVVPIERRREILKLSHSSMTGGHFSLIKTEGDPFQIPLIDDLLDSLSEAKFISKLDMTIKYLLRRKIRTKQPFVLLGPGEVCIYKNAAWVAECPRNFSAMYECCVRRVRRVHWSLY